MSKGKTVFILGAGASCEAALPTGDTLRNQIASLLDVNFEYGDQKSGDQIIVDAMRLRIRETKEPKIYPYVQAARRVWSGMQYAVSIDNYLHQHRDDKAAEFCGKLAIVRSILQAEASSLMFLQSHEPAHKFPQVNLASTWFASLWQVLTDGCRAEDLKTRFESVAFVIFNYDRCIEHYLYHALQVFYRLPASDAQQLLRSLDIYHPYGTVGQLPWWSDRTPAIGFGEEPHATQLLELSKLVKTFTESLDPSRSDIAAISETVRTASKIVILGFAFYQQNMDLLWTDKAQSHSNSGTCYATAFGISAVDADLVRGELAVLTGMPPTHVYVRMDLRCHQLFNEYRRGLRIT